MHTSRNSTSTRPTSGVIEKDYAAGESATEDRASTRSDQNPADAPLASDNVKPVYLKGLFSVATTSTKPPTQIREEIIRVLNQLGVKYTEIKGGFSCKHSPSIDLKSVVDAPQQPESSNMVTTPSHNRRLSFAGGRKNNNDGQSTPKSRRRADTVYTNSDASSDSVGGGAGNSLVVQFEIYIVKVPLLSLHGIQFKSISKNNTWQYKSLASKILSELRL